MTAQIYFVIHCSSKILRTGPSAEHREATIRVVQWWGQTYCLGLTAKLGTISPVWGLRTEIISSLIFLPTKFCSSSP